jgi:hypothetical protein
MKPDDDRLQVETGEPIKCTPCIFASVGDVFYLQVQIMKPFNQQQSV